MNTINLFQHRKKEQKHLFLMLIKNRDFCNKKMSEMCKETECYFFIRLFVVARFVAFVDLPFVDVVVLQVKERN